MIGLDNPIHLAFLLMILLLVFGAKRLPEMGRSLGAGLRGFKESINGEQPPTLEQENPISGGAALAEHGDRKPEQTTATTRA